MKTIDASGVTRQQLALLSSVAEELPEGSDLHAALQDLVEHVESGRNVVLGADSDQVSPAVAAKLLGVSRTHLYKVMDAEELSYRNVGRDRRIAMGDLFKYLEAQNELRKHVAERFAHPEATRQSALAAYKSKKKK